MRRQWSRSALRSQEGESARPARFPALRVRDGGARGGGRRPGRAPGAARPGRCGETAAEPPGAASARGGPAAQALVLAGPLAVRAGGPGAVPVRVPVAVTDGLTSTLRCWLLDWILKMTTLLEQRRQTGLCNGIPNSYGTFLLSYTFVTHSGTLLNG